MYASNFDASSFISHQYIIAGQSEHAVDYPRSLWGCPGGAGDDIAEINMSRQYPDGSNEQVCWDTTTLGDELDAAGLSWAFYATTLYGVRTGGIWSAYQTIRHIFYGPDWKNDIITPPAQFYSDVAHGNLRAVTWITPTWENSDHPGTGQTTGPAWVASVVNAIGRSRYWKSTALFIFWDDYGGWYDSEPPAYVDYDGLGIRIPMLIVSAYARIGHVSHVHYEHGSILKFIEDLWGLAPLAPSDARANSPLSDCFDFNRPPRKFEPIASSRGEAFFLAQPTSHRPPDTQ
jgi:phospholipase C